MILILHYPYYSIIILDTTVNHCTVARRKENQIVTIAFLRGRGAGARRGEEDGAGAGAGLRDWPGAEPGPPAIRLQYSSSWLPTQLGDSTAAHLDWPEPPLLVRRYEVVFSELEREGHRAQLDDVAFAHEESSKK